MKKMLCSFLSLLLLLAAVSAQATQLFSDNLNYDNGLIETDGLWYCYSPATPIKDAFVTNDLLILNSTHSDAVGVNFTNNTGSTLLYASFTINVTSLPTTAGGYFCVFRDTNNDSVSKIFIDATGTAVPNTYRLAIGNFATSSTATGVTNFPMDLATDVTYQVVFAYDPNNSDPLAGGTLWINPSTSDLGTPFGAGGNFVFPTDTSTNTALTGITIQSLGLSQYTGQGIMLVGDVNVGTTPSDVANPVPQLPIIAVQPQGASLYSGANATLYSVADGIDVTYQWLSNSVPLTDDGVTVVGSTANVLYLTNVTATATYSVVATVDGVGSVTSTPAILDVNTTPTPPFFTLQPLSVSGTLLSPVTLSAAANGTGPITYQWYLEPVGGSSFSPVNGATSATYSFSGSSATAGSYYVLATGGDGSTASITNTVTIVSPPLVSIATLKSYVVDTNASYNIAGGEIFNVQGVVTTFGDVLSSSTSEFYIEDGTAACLVYRGGFSATNTPPPGTLVQIISPAQSYYGEIEMDPTSGAVTNSVFIISTNNPLPAPLLLNQFSVMATNDSANPSNYGFGYSAEITTLTNVYLYSSATGAAVTGNFPTNSSKTLYAFQKPYVAGLQYIPVYVYTYTNVVNQSNTNFWGKPIPGFCSQLTGIMGLYSINAPRFYPSRYADFVTTPPAAFSASVKVTNGTPVVSWPAVTGSTYSLYSATNIFGPWTQTFGLSYYPSTGTYVDTNAAAAKFYQISTP